MGIPQILMIFILGVSTVVHIVKDNELMPIQRYDGVVKFIANSIIAGILYAGGFWN